MPRQFPPFLVAAVETETTVENDCFMTRACNSIHCSGECDGVLHETTPTPLKKKNELRPSNVTCTWQYVYLQPIQ
jgi:hypothetical protein